MFVKTRMIKFSVVRKLLSFFLINCSISSKLGNSEIIKIPNRNIILGTDLTTLSIMAGFFYFNNILGNCALLQFLLNFDNFGKTFLYSKYSTCYFCYILGSSSRQYGWYKDVDWYK